MYWKGTSEKCHCLQVFALDRWSLQQVLLNFSKTFVFSCNFFACFSFYFNFYSSWPLKWIWERSEKQHFIEVWLEWLHWNQSFCYIGHVRKYEIYCIAKIWQSCSIEEGSVFFHVLLELCNSNFQVCGTPFLYCFLGWS